MWTDRPGGAGTGDIWAASRDTSTNTWTSPVSLDAPINSEAWEGMMSMTTDGKELYFSSKRPGGHGGEDLYVAKRRNEVC